MEGFGPPTLALGPPYSSGLSYMGIPGMCDRVRTDHSRLHKPGIYHLRYLLPAEQPSTGFYLLPSG